MLPSCAGRWMRSGTNAEPRRELPSLTSSPEPDYSASVTRSTSRIPASILDVPPQDLSLVLVRRRDDALAADLSAQILCRELGDDERAEPAPDHEPLRARVEPKLLGDTRSQLLPRGLGASQNAPRCFLSQAKSVCCRARSAAARSKSALCFVRTSVWGLPRRMVVCVTGKP